MYTVQDYENTLRTLILLLLGEKPESYKVSAERIQKWEEKYEEELKKYHGASTEKRLIYFSGFYDLKTIVDKKWEIFKSILEDKKRFTVFFDEIAALRNTSAHGRDLFPHQLQFINFSVEDLKPKIVIHHNKNMSIDDYFIRILKVSDNYGSTWSSITSIAVKSKAVLHVGDKLMLKIDAYDPKGRPITYSIRSTKDSACRVTSTENSLTVTITPKMVGKTAVIRLSVSTDGSDYPNEKNLSIIYTVLPKQS